MDEKQGMYNKWDSATSEELRKLCTQASSRKELKLLFEASKDKINKSWDAVRKKIRRNKEWTKHFIDSERVKQEDLIEFLSKNRTVDEIGKKFKMSKDKVDKLPGRKFQNHRMITQFNVHDEPTFVILPHDPQEINPKEKVWTPYLQKDNQPYVIIKFPANDWKNIKIIPISDVIFGSSLHDAELFDEYINWINRSPHVFIFFNGDIIAYLKNLNSLKQAMLDFKYKISPIAHKILWAQQGDEEGRSKRIHKGLDPLRIICEDFGISYFEEPVYADILWKKQVFSFYCIHGFTGSQTKGGKINAAIRPLDFQEHVMFTIMSHAQDSITKEKIKICRDTVNFDLQEKRQHIIICPSFSKYFGSKRAKKGYPPPSRGTVSCNLEPSGDYYISV